jgi:hypothetical protein
MMTGCWFIAFNHGLVGKFVEAHHLSFKSHAQTFFLEYIADST